MNHIRFDPRAIPALLSVIENGVEQVELLERKVAELERDRERWRTAAREEIAQQVFDRHLSKGCSKEKAHQAADRVVERWESLMLQFWSVEDLAGRKKTVVRAVGPHAEAR